MKGKKQAAAPKKKVAGKDKAPGKPKQEPAAPAAPATTRGTMKMPAVQKPVPWPVPKKERPR